jgi:hypothetical protein
MFFLGHGNELHMRYRCGLDSMYRVDDPVIVILDEKNKELRFMTRDTGSDAPSFLLPISEILSAGNETVQTIRPGSSIRRTFEACFLPGQSAAAGTLSSARTRDEIWYVIRYCPDCCEESIGLYDRLESPNFRKWDRRLQKLIAGYGKR